MGWDQELRDELTARWDPGDTFSLREIYDLESHFSSLHPGNQHIREKLRQTLQHLRDHGILQFLGGGVYRMKGGDLIPLQVRLGYLYWKRLDSTTWHVLNGINTQQSGGGNRHIAIRSTVAIEKVVGEFDPPSSSGSRVAGTTTATVLLEDGSEKEIEISVDIRGGDRVETLLRRQFGQSQALPHWYAGASNVPDPGANPSTPQPMLYLARGADGTIIHGWADAAEIASWPEDLRSEIDGGEPQGVIDRNMPSSWEGTVLVEVLEGLDAERNVLLYGPPGTGKTWVMTEIWGAFLEGWRALVVSPAHGPQITVAPLADRWTTFHPSYTYETFVAGYKPAPTGSGFQLESFPGPALEATETARGGGTGLLLVDELNRGNAARIFGELVTVLELDKRLDGAGVKRPSTIPVRLANVDSTTTVDLGKGPVPVPLPFEMPAAVYLLGSMNSVDRTVAPVDAAVRRRFRVVELRPDLEALSTHLNGSSVPSGAISTAAEWGALAVAILRALNHRISHLAGPDFAIGHGYFWSLGSLASADERRAGLVAAWTEKIFPQIEETFRTRTEAVAAAIRLGAQGQPSDFPYRSVDPPLNIEEAGGLPFVEALPWEGHEASHEAWFRFLAELAGTAQQQAPSGSSGGPSAPLSTSAPPPGPAGAPEPSSGDGDASDAEVAPEDDVAPEDEPAPDTGDEEPPATETDAVAG